MRPRSLTVLASLALAACSCGGAPPRSVVPPASVTPTQPAFEVHEWGLVRGTASDHVMISGPRAPEPVVVMAKPVLYFHRDAPAPSDEALVVDVEVAIPDGHIVEHWPSMGGDPRETITWSDVIVQDGTCRGSRYPTLADEPCAHLTDGCEASTLAGVETADADCLSWPRPPGDDGPTEAWNHLFYRAERTTAPPLPLHATAQPDGTLRVTASATVPGSVIRLLRGNGTPGVTDGASVAAPPASGTAMTLGAPTGPLSAAASALDASLHAAGLTDDEVAAFRRAWDDAMFGSGVVASASITTTTLPVAAASPMPPPQPTRSLIYVLPIESADALATLRITPAPRAIRRAIVVWVDETATP